MNIQWIAQLTDSAFPKMEVKERCTTLWFFHAAIGGGAAPPSSIGGPKDTTVRFTCSDGYDLYNCFLTAFALALAETISARLNRRSVSMSTRAFPLALLLRCSAQNAPIRNTVHGATSNFGLKRTVVLWQTCHC